MVPVENKLLTKFYKPGSPSTMWQSSVTIGQATSEIRRRKKERKKERRSKQQQQKLQNRMAGGQL